MKMVSLKIQVIGFLVLFAGYLAILGHDIGFLFVLLFSVFVAVLAEVLFSFIKTKKFAVGSSAVITGLIVGFVLSGDEPWWKFALAALIAIGSKFILRFQKKHVFNPAAFGIIFVILLFGAQTQWRGTYVWQILVPFGLYFSYKIHKMELLAGYAAVTLVLFGLQAVYQGGSFGHVFSYLSYFFIFIMMIEPRTTPVNSLGKFIFGSGVGVMIFIFTQVGVRFDAEIAALLILNITTLLLNRFAHRKGLL